MSTCSPSWRTARRCRCGSRSREKDAAVVPDLREAAQAADSGSGSERLQIAVVYLGGKAGRSDRVEAHVLVEFKRESVWADGPVEGHEHLALLCVADALDGADQPGALGH